MTLTDADIPLGPLAGIELKLWCTKAGMLWHGDDECLGLKHQSREVVQVQPRSGVLADLVSPGQVHCVPAGDLADHFEAGRALIRFDVRTKALSAQLEQGKVDLAAFDLLTIQQEHPEVAEAPLAEVWATCLERRESFLDVLSRELADRLPVMIAAAWLRRPSKRHIRRRKYARFENIAAQEFRPLGELHEWEMRDLSSRHVLPKFLDLVKDGENPSAAAARVSVWQAAVARRAADEVLSDHENKIDGDWATLAERVLEAWTRTTERWIGLLEGICTAHHGDTFALFHEDRLPVPPYVLHRLFPCARIRTTKFTWLAGSVPAILRLFLQERVIGLNGLELDHEHPGFYDNEVPARFLRNLLTQNGFPELADEVETVASDPPQRDPVDTSHVDIYFSGFGHGLHDNGLTRADCSPPLRAASWYGLSQGNQQSESEDVAETSIPVRGLPAEVIRLLEHGNGAELLSAIQLRVRRDQLATLRGTVERTDALERDLQASLTGAWWMFGGEFVGEAVRRRLVDTIELDIPLLQPDGVLHVVELKRANTPVVRRHRNGLIVAGVVNEAVGQTMNYLTLLDEQRTALLHEFGIDTRRASATVVVGHPDFQDDLTGAEIHETLRIFTSHLSRVEVITYQQLLDRAERVLDLVGRPFTATARQV